MIDENTAAGLLRKLANARYAFALEANENRLRWRLTVNPIFDLVAFGIALPDFMFRLADRGDDFLAIHANRRTPILNRFL